MESATLVPSEIRDGLWNRYRDAYMVAASIIYFGRISRPIALCVGALILILSIAVAIANESAMLFGIGCVVTAMVGGSGWVVARITWGIEVAFRLGPTHPESLRACLHVAAAQYSGISSF
jgi:hypothetical protein